MTGAVTRRRTASGGNRSAFAEEESNLVEQVRSGFGISRRLLGRLTGYSERAIAGWEAGRRLSEPSRQRMLEMRRLQRALGRIIEAPGLSAWLERPNEAFGGFKPVEVVERGEVDRLWLMISELESGVAT